MEEAFFGAPQDCITKLKECEYNDKKELLIQIDLITLNFGFKVSKKNGDIKYIYLICQKSGPGRCLPADQKERNVTTKKISKNLINFIEFFRLPF